MRNGAGQPFSLRAGHVRQYLRERRFDVVHFQDRQAHGFECVRSKRVGLEFQNTVLVTTLHGPSRWVAEGAAGPSLRSMIASCSFRSATPANILMLL